MERRNLIISLFAIGCFIATATLIPNLGTAQADKVKAAMADLKAKTDKLGAATVEGKDLYFGTTKERLVPSKISRGAKSTPGVWMATSTS